MSMSLKRLTVDQYEQMVANGILPETNRFELIEGKLVEKMTKRPAHSVVAGLCMDAIQALLAPGWHIRPDQPVRIPSQRSEPEPDIAVVRGERAKYLDRHPGPDDVALVVEIAQTTAAKDRRLARVYGPGGIPVYWIVNLPRRRLEVYENPAHGQYPAPTILEEGESVDLTIGGRVLGQIAVADLLPRRP